MTTNIYGAKKSKSIKELVPFNLKFQFRAQTKASTLLGDNAHLVGFKILPPTLKAASEETEVLGMLNTSRASCVRQGQ